MTAGYADRFSGIARLYGAEALSRLRAAHVMVVGLGGVGSWAVEALARSGVGVLSLVDLDDVCVTNTNRQIPALARTVGLSKASVMAARVLEINPECEVRPIEEFYGPGTSPGLLQARPSFVVDAIDDVPSKALLVAECVRARLDLVVSGGAGGRIDPAAVRVGTLVEAPGDGLLRAVRRVLRAGHAGATLDLARVAAVYSGESQRLPAPDGDCALGDRRGPVRLDCATGFGAAAFVTGAFGLHLAAVVVNRLAATAVSAG